MRTKKKLNITGVLIICLAAILLLGALIIWLGSATQGFMNWDIHAPNEDNLYQKVSFADDDGIIGNNKYGVTVKLTEDNELKLNGKAEQDLEIVVGTYTLEANTSYIFDSSLNKGSEGTIYMALLNASETAIAESYNGAAVIDAEDLTEDTVVQIVIYVAEGTSVDNIKLRPILCEGDDVDNIVKFY